MRINLRLNLVQFRIIFIAWSIWNLMFIWIFFNSIKGLIYDAYLQGGWHFKAFPYFIIALMLLAPLLLLNFILFYVLHIDRIANCYTTLRWISIGSFVLFAYCMFCTRDSMTGKAVGHQIFYLILHLLVLWKQEAYFNFIRSKTLVKRDKDTS